MSAHVIVDPTHEPGAYISRSGRLYEVLRFDQVSPFRSELWVENCSSFDRFAFDNEEQKGIELVRAAPAEAPDAIPEEA